MISDFVSKLIAPLLSAIEKLEIESLEWQKNVDHKKIAWRVLIITVLAGVILSLLEYHGSSGGYKIFTWPLGLFVDEPEKVLKSLFRKGDRAELFRLSYWAGACFVGYFLIPVFIIKVFWKEKISDYGIRFKGTLEHAWVYVAMYIVVMPFVVMVALTDSFRKTYPFYENAGMSIYDFLGWEFVYAIQFFSLEFFFRGFLINGTKHRFGYYAIMFSVVPYCMIHFGKPLPETVGAIIAGIALGSLAIFTRSVLLGFAIHVSVALSMDAICVVLTKVDTYSAVLR